MPPFASSLFPSRVRAAGLIAALFLAVNFAVRAVLAANSWPALHLGAGPLLEVFGLGLVNDLAVAGILFAVLLVLQLPFPATPRGARLHGLLFSGSCFVLAFGMLFVAVAEWLFWNEFSARFNFIAVDYLIYTREVVGNIRQSYSLPLILGGIGAASVMLALALGRRLWRLADGAAPRLGGRAAWALAVVVASVAFVQGTAAVSESIDDGGARELSGNGYREFVVAFQSNNLDYFRYYPLLPGDTVRRMVRAEFAEAQSQARFTDGANPLERTIAAHGPARRRNVVLVSIESLGADYVGALGDGRGLTPNLDRLAGEGLLFTHVYATGLRTVRGLEALTLSVPPTPGHAVPMRPDHTGFETLGEVFRAQGYEALYLYGGYSQFDNMKNFFGDNGYTVIDRTAIDAAHISHETIWGVADEDLFAQALREIDRRAAAGRPVFAHVMTTSNHRPFTYPDGRIDLPSGSGRDGAVKYTDYAIGRFMAEAARRPWFADTLFVFVADHTSHGRGRTDLPPENFHIPLLMVAPGWLAPGRVDQLASQIDVGPTVLALLGIPYTSRFFGQDILTEGVHHQRAFLANYLTVGYLQDGKVVELSPKGRARVRAAADGRELPPDDPDVRHVRDEAIAYYQMASALLNHRSLSGAPVHLAHH